MTLTVEYLVVAGDRRSVTRFHPDAESYRATLPTYTEEQITGLALHRLKVTQ